MLAEGSGSRWNSVAIVALLVASSLAAGCFGEDDTGVQAAGEACNATAAVDERSSGAQVSCKDARGQAVHSQSFACENPDRGGVSLAADVAEGSLTVTVEDANEERVVEETYDRQGEFDDSRSFEGGEPGRWVLLVERHDGFEGGFGVHAACAK